MTSDIILQHIDVIVIGPKKYEFIELILQKQLFIKTNNILSSSSIDHNHNHNDKKNRKSYNHNHNRHKSIQNCQKQKLKIESKKKSGYLQILSSFLPSSKKYLKSQFQKNNSHSLISQNTKAQALKSLNIQNKKNQSISQKKQPQKQKQPIANNQNSKQKKKHYHNHSHQQLIVNSNQSQNQSQNQIIPVSSQTFKNSLPQTLTHSVSSKFCGIKKFSKVIQTPTFWITINFFIFDMKIYDPILSQYSKGNISICIMVDQDENQQLLLSEQNQNEQDVQDQENGNINISNENNDRNDRNDRNDNLQNNSNQLKNYLVGNNNNSFNYNYLSTSISTSLIDPKEKDLSSQQAKEKEAPLRMVKNEMFLQSKILSRFHVPTISGFSSLLKIKLTQQNRLIQQSNNLRLSNNQVFRWIVDCYFENKYRIKLKQSLGDQIQKGDSLGSNSNNGNGNGNGNNGNGNLNGSRSKASTSTSAVSSYGCQIM